MNGSVWCHDGHRKRVRASITAKGMGRYIQSWFKVLSHSERVFEIEKEVVIGIEIFGEIKVEIIDDEVGTVGVKLFVIWGVKCFHGA